MITITVDINDKLTSDDFDLGNVSNVGTEYFTVVIPRYQNNHDRLNFDAYLDYTVTGGMGDRLTLGTATAGIRQVETATVSGTITTGGNISVVVTSSLITTTTLTIPVRVGNIATEIGEKIRQAMRANTVINGAFWVSGTGANVVLTCKVGAINDSTLNIAIDDVAPCEGITDVVTSTHTTAGNPDYPILTYVKESPANMFLVNGVVKVGISVEKSSVPYYWSSLLNNEFNVNSVVIRNEDIAEANPDLIKALQEGKLDKTGNGSDVTVAFTEASELSNITTGDKLSIIFSKVKKLITSFLALAETVSNKVDKVTGKSLIFDTEITRISENLSGTASGTNTGDQDLSGLLAKTGDGSDVTVAFTETATLATITTGSKLSVIVGMVKKLITDFLALVTTVGQKTAKTEKPIIKWVAGTYAQHDKVWYQPTNAIYSCRSDGTTENPTEFLKWLPLTGSDFLVTDGGGNSSTLGSMLSNINNSLPHDGDGSDVTAEFTQAISLTNIATGDKLSVIFGKVKKLIVDFLALVTTVGTKLSTVTTNTTLTGNGTVASPLSVRSKTVVDHTVNVAPISMLASQVSDDGGGSMMITMPNHGIVDNTDLLELSGTLPTGITKQNNSKLLTIHNKAYLIAGYCTTDTFVPADYNIGTFAYIDGGTDGWTLTKLISTPLSFSGLSMSADGDEWNVKLSGTLASYTLFVSNLYFMVNGLSTNIYYSTQGTSSYQIGSFTLGANTAARAFLDCKITINLKRVSATRVDVTVVNNSSGFVNNSGTPTHINLPIGGHIEGSGITDITSFMFGSSNTAFVNGFKVLIERVN